MSKLFELTFEIDQFRGWVLTLLVLPVLGKVLEEGGSSSRCSMSRDPADSQIARHSFRLWVGEDVCCKVGQVDIG